jgi:hypothetical protein
MTAYCWQNGIIGFGRCCPKGAIEIASHPGRRLRQVVTMIANSFHNDHSAFYFQNVRMADELGLDPVKELGWYIRAVKHRLADLPGWPPYQRSKARGKTSTRRAAV